MSPNEGWGGVGWGGVAGSQPTSTVHLYTGAQINFGDPTPYSTYGFGGLTSEQYRGSRAVLWIRIRGIHVFGPPGSRSFIILSPVNEDPLRETLVLLLILGQPVHQRGVHVV
jgi:hypothetical protein